MFESSALQKKIPGKVKVVERAPTTSKTELDMAAVKMIRELKRRLDAEKEDRAQENEDPKTKKQRQGKAGSALATTSINDLSIRRGEIVFTHPV